MVWLETSGRSRQYIPISGSCRIRRLQRIFPLAHFLTIIYLTNQAQVCILQTILENTGIGVRPKLTDIAEEVKARLAQLNKEEARIKFRLAEIQPEKAKLNAASERIELLRSGKSKLIDYGCPNCFVFHGIESEMAPIPYDIGHVDLFRCHKCNYELEKEF